MTIEKPQTHMLILRLGTHATQFDSAHTAATVSFLVSSVLG